MRNVVPRFDVRSQVPPQLLDQPPHQREPERGGWLTARGGGLQAQAAGDELKVVRDAVVKLAEQHLFSGEGLPEARLAGAQRWTFNCWIWARTRGRNGGAKRPTTEWPSLAGFRPFVFVRSPSPPVAQLAW